MVQDVGFQDPSAEVLAAAATTFGLLSSAARLHIVWALAEGESDVSGLALRVGGALPAVSQHLTKLKLAGLVRSRREGRRQVYFDHTPSLHVGANRISQYQTFTPASFAASPALQTRARIFLRRELRVFGFLDRRPAGANREFLIEYLVAVLKSNDPKGADGHAEELVKEFLGREDARLLLHELDAWLRSPYERLEAWDSHVQYGRARERANGSDKREQP